MKGSEKSYEVRFYYMYSQIHILVLKQVNQSFLKCYEQTRVPCGTSHMDIVIKYPFLETD